LTVFFFPIVEAHYGYYNNIPVSTAVPVPTTSYANHPAAYAVPPTPSPVVLATELPATFDLGRNPVQLICPCCKRNVLTRTKTSPNWMTWSAVAGVAVLFWPVFFVPLFIDPVSLKLKLFHIVVISVCNLCILLLNFCSTPLPHSKQGKENRALLSALSRKSWNYTTIYRLLHH
jgi:hypothetical protein